MLDKDNVIYLDNAATSWPKPQEVADVMSDFIRRRCANPGRSGHRMSVDTARMIFSVRNSISDLLGSPDPLMISFTHNATYALNIAINGLLKPGDHVITSSVEHHSVMRPLRALEADGVELTVLPCARDGTLDPCEINRAIKKNTRAIVLTHASNVTGTILPIDEAGVIARNNNICLIVDSAQTAGVLPINVIKSGIDLLAFTGHKGLYGPQGTGGLYIHKGLEDSMKPFILGGTGSKSEMEEQPDFMPDKFESGTPNSPGIAGLGAGIEFLFRTGIDKIMHKKQTLTRKFIDGIQSIKGVTVYGPKADKGRISIISINIAGKSASEVSQSLDEDFGIMTRPGLHCAPSAHRTIGTFPGGTVRFCIGYFNTEDHISAALRALEIISAKK